MHDVLAARDQAGADGGEEMFGVTVAEQGAVVTVPVAA